MGGGSAGNFWVVDVDPETRSWRTVFYACHDPPVLIVQAASLADFLQQLFEPHEAALERVAYGADMAIWREDAFLLRVDHPPLPADEPVRSFAAHLGPGSASRISESARSAPASPGAGTLLTPACVGWGGCWSSPSSAANGRGCSSASSAGSSGAHTPYKQPFQQA